MSDELDRRFMGAAIRLGAGALGTTWPNPSVGALLVRQGRVMSRGRTARGGRPHAEATTLSKVEGHGHGATLYVSLEPCSHQGRTPPCTNAIRAAKVERVVAPAEDPDPRVSGRGFDALRIAGIEVATGLLAAEAARVQAGHLRRTASGRPHVLLKLAVSADGGIGRIGEGAIQVTGEIARRHVQALRSRFDAILVGRGTVEADDPQLTCRLPGLEDRSPVRVILDSGGRLNRDRRVFDTAKSRTWVFDSISPDDDAGHLRRFHVPRGSGPGLDLAAVLSRLADEGITRLLVEGGARVARSFLEADLVDEVLLFRNPDAIGDGAVPALAGLPLSLIEERGRFEPIERRHFGRDRMSRYVRAR